MTTTMTAAQAIGHRHNIEPGDWFRAFWGYDQTNASFYQVVNVSKSGKTVTVQQYISVHADPSAQTGCRDIVTPDLDQPHGGPRTRRLQEFQGEALFVTERYAGAPMPRLLPKSDDLPTAGQTSSVEGH